MKIFFIVRFKNGLNAPGVQEVFYEEKLTALEEEEADALEVAAKEDEEGEEKEEAQGINLKLYK